MKKKIMLTILVVVIFVMLVVMLCGCMDMTPHNTIDFSDRFIILKERTVSNAIYIEMYDKNTKVMYVFIKLGNAGNLTVLVNADGTPMLHSAEVRK